MMFLSRVSVAENQSRSAHAHIAELKQVNELTELTPCTAVLQAEVVEEIGLETRRLDTARLDAHGHCHGAQPFKVLLHWTHHVTRIMALGGNSFRKFLALIP